MKRHPPAAPTLSALRLFPSTFSIRTAARRRAWMDATGRHFAYRCLPMVMANQAGWMLASGRSVVAEWNGGAGRDDLRVESEDGTAAPASSQFGHGILTWDIPFLFRTSPGYNLLVRGPANWWKDGAVALEGLVETDWAVATFTVNWKLTRPGLAVRFDPDDPICMLVPQRRGELESFHPVVAPLESAPEALQQYHAWEQARNGAIEAILDPARPANQPTQWELDYLRGTSPGGAAAREHQLRLELRDFDDCADGEPGAP
ncbi:MAG: hypothetical protein H0X69_05260 [Gemmatimonadales bacterium]|nr:hypothetical protein [Gemmatimonadales bacterium]